MMLLQSRAALVAASKRTLSLPGSWQGGKVKQADNLSQIMIYRGLNL